MLSALSVVVNAQADAQGQESFAGFGVATQPAVGSRSKPEISAGHHKPNPLPGTFGQRADIALPSHCQPVAGFFIFRSRETSSTRLLVKSSRGPEPTTHGINMSETFTIVGVGLTSSSVGVTFATLFPEATPAVMLGSLAGTALYVLTSDPHQLWKQAIFALISFISGVFFSVPMAKIMAGIINTPLSLMKPPASIEVSPAVGAIVTASISVAVLLRILRKSKSGKMPGLGEEDK